MKLDKELTDMLEGKTKMKTKNKYFNFGMTTLYVHLDLELTLLGDIKTSKEEEEKHLENIREIKKIIKRRKELQK